MAKRYELGDLLGTGGMAEVYQATDRVLGRTVAVKMLLPQFANDDSFIARFRREAQAAAGLNHPNIVGVYDTGDDGGEHYIVMEYVEGRTLRDVVRQDGPLLPERAAEIAADAAAALAYAGSRGLVHRDVKPGNIMLTPEGDVKVTDFGIARAVAADTMTQTATVLGTAQYFSPEQAQGAAVDTRSDVYSLGVVLYEMLTQQVPFTGSSPVAIAYKHVKENPVPPHRINPDVPEDLEAITMKALAKNPANRYQTAQEMREDLMRALSGRPVMATPVLDDATAIVSPLADDTVVVGRVPVAKRAPDPVQRRRATGYLILGGIAIVAIAVLLWAFTGLFKATPRVVVPDVVGQEQAAAQRILRADGFDVIVADPVPNSEFDKGTVFLQDPPPGTSLEEGDTVTITPSDGPQLVAVPDVLGKTQAEAEDILRRAGLEVRVRSFPRSREPAGTVYFQRPGKGSFAEAGTEVEIRISEGKPTRIVPDVLGKTESDARELIQARDLAVEVRYEEQTPGACEVPAGRVCRQDPEGGAEVDEGATVVIVVAEEPGPPEPTPTPTPSPTGSPTAAGGPSGVIPPRDD